MRAKGKRLKRSEVFNMYEEYCKENGRQGHGKSNFFRNMTDKGFLLKQYNGEFYYLNRRSQKKSYNWVEFLNMLDNSYPLVRPRIYVNIYE